MSTEVALFRSNLARTELNRRFCRLPQPLQELLTTHISQAVQRDSQGAAMDWPRRRELEWMNRAVVCQRVPELQGCCQRFLRARLDYLREGGAVGRLA